MSVLAPPSEPSASPATGYYGRPMLKAPVWKPEVAWYFFAGGLAGVSAVVALGARIAGNRALHRAALAGAFLGSLASPPLLISDLGRPERFLNMLRLVKATSPMSIGSWVLAAFGASTGAAAAGEFVGLARPLGRLAEVAAAALGLPLATYTAVLAANTSVPVWREAGDELPFVFAAGAVASAGAVGTLLTPPAAAAPARRLAIAGALAEVGAAAIMERRLGATAEAYRSGEAARYKLMGGGLLLGGAALLGVAGRRRLPSAAGACLILGGAIAERFAVFRAGNPSRR